MNKAITWIIGVVVVVIVVIGVVWYMRSRSTQPPTPSQSTSTTTPIQPVEQTITITSSGFQPPSVKVPVGTTLTFKNTDTNDHQLASDPHPIHTNFSKLNLGILKPNASGDVLFDKAGTFGYHDHLSPALRGSVIVE